MMLLGFLLFSNFVAFVLMAAARRDARTYRLRWQEANALLEAGQDETEPEDLEWHVEVGDDPSHHRAVVTICAGKQRMEISRIGYDRQSSRNPELPFSAAIDRAMTDAQRAIKKLRENLVVPS